MNDNRTPQELETLEQPYMQTFKQQMKEAGPLIGTLVTIGMPVVSEVLSKCGFDWLWIDLEHAPLSLEQAQQLLQAKKDTTAAFIRVPENSEVWIKRTLDLGADGIIVPQVKTAAEAARAVAAAKYPPLGVRSVGLARAHGYGMDFAEYVEKANEETLVILQVEHKEGVDNIDSILNTSGIDAIIIGPYDLSGSLGKLGQVQDPAVQSCIKTVASACKKKNMPIGIFALKPEQAKEYVAQGYDLIAVGIDVQFLWNSARTALESLAAAPIK